MTKEPEPDVNIPLTIHHFNVFHRMNHCKGDPKKEFKAYDFFKSEVDKESYAQFIEKGYMDVSGYRINADVSVTKRKKGGGLTVGDLACVDGLEGVLPYFDRILQLYQFMKFSPERLIKIGTRHIRRRQNTVQAIESEEQKASPIIIQYNELSNDFFRKKMVSGTSYRINDIPNHKMVWVIRSFLRGYSNIYPHNVIYRQTKSGSYLKCGRSFSRSRGWRHTRLGGGRRRRHAKNNGFEEKMKTAQEFINFFKTFYYRMAIRDCDLNEDEIKLLKPFFKIKRIRFYGLRGDVRKIFKSTYADIDVEKIRFYKLLELIKYLIDYEPVFEDVIKFYEENGCEFDEYKEPKPRKKD